MDSGKFLNGFQAKQDHNVVKTNGKKKKSIFSRFKNAFKSDTYKKKLSKSFDKYQKGSSFENSFKNIKHGTRETTGSLNEDTEDEHNEEATFQGSENSHDKDDLHFEITNDPESMISPAFSPSSFTETQDKKATEIDTTTTYLENTISAKMNIVEEKKFNSPQSTMVEENIVEGETKTRMNMAIIAKTNEEESSTTMYKDMKKISMNERVMENEGRKNFEFLSDGTPVVLGYVVGETLGTGMSGKVKLGRHVDNPNNKVALKIITTNKKSALMLRLLQTELNVMKRINSHPNILKLIDSANNVAYQESIDSEVDRSICMALELASNGELFDYILHSDVFNEILARTYAYQLISAISYCHENGIIHRDIKPENLLLDSNFQLKVADFGLSSDKNNFVEFLSTECGTKAYMAPEVLSKNRYLGEKSDCWSIGVVLFIMLSGNPPFQIADTNDWWFKQLATNRPERFWKAHLSYYPKFPRQSMTMIGRMFQPNPKYRYTVKEISQDRWMNAQKLNEEELFTEMSMRKLKVQHAKLKERQNALASKEASQNAAANFCKAAGTKNQISDPFNAKVSRSIQRESSNDALERESVLPPILLESEEDLMKNTSFYQVYTGADGFSVVDKVSSLIMAHDIFRPVAMLQKKDTFSYLIKGANVEFALNIYRVLIKNEEKKGEEMQQTNFITMLRVDRIRGDLFSFGLMFKVIHQTISRTKVRFNSDIVVIQDNNLTGGKETEEISVSSNESILDEKIGFF